ncbi:ABC transporter ATP-binding protein [Mycobacterium sp. KBS0706]|uniref:ABC transporter ATP-binding protein n=1 Tax=Mycobacterium sp. KBS0706 TaxID=2578109 RepID=UPI00110FC539|nr:ABC transporter ATP-binding protein [Mycobacterium sp. KBS0706]TSD85586.1 ABC transporter ATP-binding protein [Mycobacterium sp. KBS0706]
MALETAAVVARDVVRSFQDQAVLQGVDLDILPGEFVVLLGRSGSGKSTFLRGLGALDAEVEGFIRVPRRRAIVFQDPRLMPWLPVLRNVTIGLPQTRETRERGLAALEEVGLEAKAKAWPRTLSGGEAQRVALARAMVREPQLLLLDEPFGALDALTRIRMHALLQDLYQRHRPAVLLVTHDVDEAILLADRVLVLTKGRLSLDLPVGVDAPRSRSDPRFAAQRRRLLAELGVTAD